MPNSLPHKLRLAAGAHSGQWSVWVPDISQAGALHGCAGRGVLWEGLVWEDEVGNPACAPLDP